MQCLGFRVYGLGFVGLGLAIFWVAVKELNLSYYIGGNHIDYYIYPLW